MGFLTPALLALGAAVVVPLILHLFQRHQGPRVVFPALRYLRRAEKEHARKIRMRQLLLMMLRIAALALLALAAARPFLRAAGAGHEPTAVVLVLDNSMSSGLVIGDRRILDHLKDRALETLQRAGREDRFWLFRAGQPWDPALSGDAETTAQRVRDTQPTAAAADLVAAVSHARAVLEAGAGALAREIHLLTDLQATNLRDGVASAPANAPPLLVWHPRDDVPDNAHVAELRIGGGIPPTENQRSVIAARIAGSTDVDSIAVRLSLDDRVVAVGSGASGDVVLLPFPPRSAGLVTGWVETDADPLRADDRRAFALRVRPAPAVATSAGLAFAEHALAVMQSAGRIQRTNMADADVLILPGGSGLESVPPGRAVVVLAPDSALELPAANRRLANAGIPWRFEPASGTGEARFDIDPEGDELMRTLASVRVRVALTLAPQSENADTVLLRLTDETPWAVRGERRGGGTYIVIASPLSETATTLPTSAAMVPLLDRIVSAWTVADATAVEFAPGTEVAVPAGAAEVERPDGTREAVSAGDRYRLGGEAGIYIMRSADSTIAAFAANPIPAESDLRRLATRDLERAFPQWSVIRSDRPEQWTSRIYRGRLGREVWQPFLLLALIVLFVEAIVAATGAQRKREQSGVPRPSSTETTPAAAAND